MFYIKLYLFSILPDQRDHYLEANIISGGQTILT